MAFLSQASHLGSLLLPHDAFQEHAAHVVEWSTTLSSKGSESTCIRSGIATFLHYAFTAHSDLVVNPWPLDVTGCKFSVAQMLRSSAQREGSRIRRERHAKKNAWGSEPA